MGTWYRTGTVAVTNGSADVVGTSTLWLSQASVGDIFIGPDLALYEITVVTDDTNISIKKLDGTAAYNGATLSAQDYAIIRNFTSTLPAQLAASLAALMASYHVTLDELVAWLSGTGTVTLHDAVGNAYDVMTPRQLEAAWTGRLVNDIGIPGAQGFGVGVCPTLPAGFASMAGTFEPGGGNYGNYTYSDGSVMVWVPAFYYKWGTGANGLAVNDVDVKPFSAFADVATANASGYALHRAFYDNNVVQSGFFVDKYLCSNNANTASSIPLGNPLSSNAAHNPFSGLTGAPPNFYYGAIAAAKTRGASFFCSSRFIFAALALLSYAHGKAAASATWCAWYSSGSTNFPKGCNNNALGDAQDATLAFTSDGYSNAAKTGSANLFARTAHNGQACGVTDLNGNMWEITPGIATDDAGTTYYILKKSAQMKNVTGGNALATDLWGATGLAALYDSLGATYAAALASSTLKYYGAATQVLSEAVSGNAWNWAGAGAPLAAGVGGSNPFGSDGFWDYRPAAMCPISGGSWSYSSSAGVWALHLSNVRGTSSNYVGFRAALYL